MAEEEDETGPEEAGDEGEGAEAGEAGEGGEEEANKSERSDSESEDEVPRKASKHVTIVLEEDSSKFKPQFYTFRRMDQKNVARGPPFWVLTDHLIAVIWHLFKDPPSEEPIGISQLQWSLEFLRNIRDDTGEYPEYVKAAIQGLEDRLLELYASVPSFFGEGDEDVEEEEKKAGEEGEEGEDEEGGGGEDEEKGVDEGEEGEEEDGTPKKEKSDSEAKTVPKPVNRRKKVDDDDDDDNNDDDDDAEDEEDYKGSIQVKDNMVDRPSQSMAKRMSMRESKMRADPMKELLSSVTIKDILSKSPKKPPKDPELESLIMARKCSTSSMKGKSPKSSDTRMTGSGTKMVEGAAKNDMMRFLNSLRKEQTDRISIELKQLEKINDFLREVETGQCSPKTMREIKETKQSKTK